MLVVFPGRSPFCRGWCRGTDEIGGPPRRNAETFAGTVAVHGVFGSGPTLDETFGFDRYQKSRWYVVIYSMGGMKQTITRKHRLALGKRFGVTPLASAVALY